MLDNVRSAVRSLLGVAEGAERELDRHSPIEESRQLEDKLHEGVEALERAADSLEQHIAIAEKLAASLPPLTESVTLLTEQLSQLLEVTRPLEIAERDVSRLRGVFRRGRYT